MEDLEQRLQHPRRHLGDRHLAQARKFLKLALRDPERASGNLDWAEQHARQALLYDFTQADARRLLVDLKFRVEDEAGVHAVLEDLFTVLGRDPERAAQLRGVTLLPVASELLEAALLKDPLDADVSWTHISEGDSAKDALDEFAGRCRRLDFTDARASVIFARRLIRVRRRDEDLFVDLSSHLLAHRPQNHELWLDLGRLHETREREYSSPVFVFLILSRHFQNLKIGINQPMISLVRSYCGDAIIRCLDLRTKMMRKSN